MLSRVNWAEDRTYQTGGTNEPFEFYTHALCNSKEFDLLLGYFSSSAINVLSLGFASFLCSGGKMRMVINNILSEKDKEAVKKGLKGDISPLVFNLSDIRMLRETLDEYDKYFFECLAWLIAHERIEIKIIQPKTGKGISHYKSGVFRSENQKVGFRGSCNFTAFGLLENLEEVDCYLSWDDKRSLKKIENQETYFQNIIDGQAKFVDYLDPDKIRVAIKENFGNKNLQDLLIKQKDFITKKNALKANPRLATVIQKVTKQLEEIERQQNLPKFPFAEGPRDYQMAAYDKWISNGKKGLFAMATGTGKTLTSLNCLLNEYKGSGTYKAVILVPTIALLEQWREECQKFNFKNIISISSKEKWPEDIAFYNTASNFIDVSFVIIVTYASFYRKKFQNHFQNLSAETLLIADEAHNMGAANISKILPQIHLQKRIGLSATPDRKYDELGNAAIQNFFNDAPPFVCSYTMKQAMEKGWLCPYKYFPHIVRLSDVEFNEYKKKSKQLMQFFDPATKKYKDCKEVEILLLERKRIIHKAEEKLEVFSEIIHKEFRNKGHLKYTLVYVPEGIEPDYEKTDKSIEEEQDIKLINEFTRTVSSVDPSIMVRQYTSNTPNREEVIHSFQEGYTHVLTSMKCLDEGVDVPRSELAVFCSSTGNPRQFIQRRGRVLRTHPEKTFAVIHDLVVVPSVAAEDDFYEMEKNLIKKELERVSDFSSLALNKIDTYNSLKPVLDYYNLTL